MCKTGGGSPVASKGQKLMIAVTEGPKTVRKLMVVTEGVVQRSKRKSHLVEGFSF
jgi:hypothetical protein